MSKVVLVHRTLPHRIDTASDYTEHARRMILSSCPNMDTCAKLGPVAMQTPNVLMISEAGSIVLKFAI